MRIDTLLVAWMWDDLGMAAMRAACSVRCLRLHTSLDRSNTLAADCALGVARSVCSAALLEARRQRCHAQPSEASGKDSLVALLHDAAAVQFAGPRSPSALLGGSLLIPLCSANYTVCLHFESRRVGAQSGRRGVQQA